MTLTLPVLPEGRVRDVVRAPDPVLADPGPVLDPTDPEVGQLCADLVATMRVSPGCVGLAAPQVGLPLRLFVMDCDGIKLVAANPEIVSAEGEQEGEEGCLSVGKIHAPLRRAERVVLRAQDEHGHPYEREATGLAARCFLHETDHNDGTLFIERLSPLKRDMVKKRFQKMRKWR